MNKELNSAYTSTAITFFESTSDMREGHHKISKSNFYDVISNINAQFKAMKRGYNSTNTTKIFSKVLPVF